jgi:phage tail-like protein
MRGEVESLCSPRPLMDTMPFVYRGDHLAEQLCASFDDVLAPIFATLDCLTAYLDPKTAPADMLDWLAGWIGLTVGGHEPVRKRELITAGAAMLPWRGTVRSVHEAVVAAFDRETEVIESGSATWSTTPNSRPGGQHLPSLIVRVTVDKEDDVDQRSLDALVDSVKPAHIPHRVELVIRSPPPSGDDTDQSESAADSSGN